MRWGLVALFVSALIGTLFFGLRSYRTWLLLRSAYAMDAPDLGNIRAWMTLGYVSRLYRIPEAALLERLQLPPVTSPETPLKALAQVKGETPFAYIQRVQRTIAAVERNREPNGRVVESNWLSALSDQLLAALLIYGYPALGVILVIGSIGVPLPDGLLTAAAGSLIAQNRMTWVTAGAVAVGATVAGDVVGYYLGLILGEEFLKRRGAWIGYTEARRHRAQTLFARWGWAAVLLTRTLASSVSSVANLAAGASGYRPASFLGSAVAGRILWTGAYLGLGYGVGGALEAANGFLANLTGLLIALTVAIWAAWFVFRKRAAHLP
jgi:membrane protein DedA with SNARE-associated domain